MKRYCIINIDNLRDVTLIDDLPLDVEVLKGNCGPSPFYYDRDKAESELLKLTEKYGPKFHLFESTDRAIIRRALLNGQEKRVVIIEAIN